MENNFKIDNEEELNEEKLIQYIQKNGFGEIPNSNKERLKTLTEIIYSIKTNIIWNGMLYQKAIDKHKETVIYTDKIKNLEVDLFNARFYIGKVSLIVKQERKIAIKTAVKKFLRIK